MSTDRTPRTRGKRTARPKQTTAAKTRRKPGTTTAADAKTTTAGAKPADANGGPQHRQPRQGSTMAAAITVLTAAEQPMTAKEIYAQIRAQDLAPGLKGKTPEQTLAAQLAVHAKRGRYVERATPGKFRLKPPT